ncbi:MAG: hypothetical protein PHD56_03595 [Anaerostipes sp.]|nr:hypothetical protein [Anaerostipes sp.]
MKLNELGVDDSFFAFKQVQSLEIVYQLVREQNEKLSNLIDIEDFHEIVKSIRGITSDIYSGCEILNQLFISVYRNDDRYRGTNLKRGFNDNFKIVYNAKMKRDKDVGIIFKDKFIHTFFNDAELWFVELHDIRTQETHYEVGEVENRDGELYYCNNNRNGVSKQIYTNPSDIIDIPLSRLIQLIEMFLEAENIVANKIKQVMTNSPNY